MSGRDVAVSVEWALHGKTAEAAAEGYRILACSRGDLRRRNFEDVHARFSPGTPQALPQVSLSYLIRADQPDGEYLTLAIHEESGPADHFGRVSAVTRYFCVPYAMVRADGVSYRAMFEAFRAIELPAPDGQPQTVELAVPPLRAPPDDELARQVAALLLSAPVCVLGAEGTAMNERLGFIDTVMTLLPYGMRARMTAATWTRATTRSHRFRLFFSDAPRGGDARDHVVTWGHPDRTGLPAGHQRSASYLAWLDDMVRQPVRRLAEATESTGFSPKQVSQMLERIGIPAAGPAMAHPAGEQNLTAAGSASARRDGGEAALLGCAEHLRTGDMPGLVTSIAEITSRAAHDPPADEDRQRCREIITRHNLLRPGLPAGQLLPRFYDAVLPLAFGTPLTYRAYCQLEDCLDAAGQPDRGLFEAIERGGLKTFAVTTLVRWHLGGVALDKWLRQANVKTLVDLLAAGLDRPRHEQIFCEALLRCLDLRRAQPSYDPQVAWVALRQHGYLAQILQWRYPGHPEYQSQVLTEFLRACFGEDLDRVAVTEVMSGAKTAPTPALLAAVLLMLRDPDDAGFVKSQYVDSVCEHTKFAKTTHDRLQRTIGKTRKGRLGGAADEGHGPAGAGHETGQFTPAALPGWRRPRGLPPLPPRSRDTGN